MSPDGPPAPSWGRRINSQLNVRLKPSLIDSELRQRTTRRKQAKAGQRERLSEKGGRNTVCNSPVCGITKEAAESGRNDLTRRKASNKSVYVSDFGTLRIVPNRFSRDGTVLVLDMDYWAVAYLQGMTKTKLAKTGMSEKWMITTEVTLESRNEAASGKVTTCTTS